MPDHAHHSHSQHAPIPAGAPSATDPVCGMNFEVKANTRTQTFGGETHHFCSASCEERFKADPWFYASGNADKVGLQAQPGTQWTCPMHPEIVRDEPGACPICGMAL